MWLVYLLDIDRVSDELVGWSHKLSKIQKWVEISFESLRSHKEVNGYLISEVILAFSQHFRAIWSDSVLFSADSATMCSEFSVFQTSTSHLATPTQIHTPLLVAITNKVKMTQEEVCVWAGGRNPTGPSWKKATGTSGDGLVHVCRNDISHC